MSQNFKESLKPYIAEIDRALLQLPVRNIPSLLNEPITYFLNMPGKRIRPLLTIITAEAYGNNLTNILPAAIAIEILHDFTLIHDDIMDEDQFRRGLPTVHEKWDIGTAILAGDAMVSLAYTHLLSCKSPNLTEMLRTFTDGMFVVCAGQALDKEFETKSDITLNEYLDMINKKTARLIALAFELGYLGSVKETPHLNALVKMGHFIGLAFQIHDDLLDYTADQQNLGKDVGSDWRQHKKSYIAIAYDEFKDKAIGHQSLFDFPSFEEAKDCLQKLGIFDKTKEVIHNYLGEAKKIAGEIEFSHPIFEQLIDFLEKRSY
ncbi:MAG: polyprenyl synthetase family protein [Calditrichia bacterium]